MPIDSKFGFMARAGFEYGHLRLGLEYNFVSDKAGYFGIKLSAPALAEAANKIRTDFSITR